jgi:hypothetical protein
LASLIKVLKPANLKENVSVPKTDAMIAEVRFVCKLVLRANSSFSRFARKRPSCFTGKSQFFHVLPVSARLVLRANLSFSRFARNRPSRFTGKSHFFTFCP